MRLPRRESKLRSRRSSVNISHDNDRYSPHVARIHMIDTQFTQFTEPTEPTSTQSTDPVGRRAIAFADSRGIKSTMIINRALITINDEITATDWFIGSLRLSRSLVTISFLKFVDAPLHWPDHHQSLYKQLYWSHTICGTRAPFSHLLPELAFRNVRETRLRRHRDVGTGYRVGSLLLDERFTKHEPGGTSSSDRNSHSGT